MNILAIETSCDDTGVAVVNCSKKGCKILSNVISSQIAVHAPYGGVVPNLAARAHLDNIQPCLNQAVQEAGRAKIGLIAVTVGPGLAPSLLVGVNFAKALAYANSIPLAGVNHMEGHIYANWLALEGLAPDKIKFPALCLVVSGGHTQLVLIKSHGQYELLGETRDDAAGEAFDKAAKLIDLGYPGGPAMSKAAAGGHNDAFQFPRPMTDTDNFEFSFSGLKTALLYTVRKLGQPLLDKTVSDLAASYQEAIVDVLVIKTMKAVKRYNPETVLLSGGVAANKLLRERIAGALEKHGNVEFHLPPPVLCTDNAAMIAAAAFYGQAKRTEDWSSVCADANLELF